MAQAFLALQVVGAAAGTLGAVSEAKGEAANLEAQARLADTQALQRDTANRDELTRFLSSMAASRGANGLSQTSPNGLLLQKDSKNTADRDRLRGRADDSQRASNFRAAAQSKRSSARFSLFTGAARTAKAGLSLYEYNR